ncbi:hypothetical protein PG985_013468 [Apiospora marii]|uniref:uncharacterized protein n=1 Tax=Apiospora marii TaxID=335849 RepID=UPI0031327249
MPFPARKDPGPRPRSSGVGGQQHGDVMAATHACRASSSRFVLANSRRKGRTRVPERPAGQKAWPMYMPIIIFGNGLLLASFSESGRAHVASCTGESVTHLQALTLRYDCHAGAADAQDHARGGCARLSKYAPPVRAACPVDLDFKQGPQLVFPDLG